MKIYNVKSVTICTHFFKYFVANIDTGDQVEAGQYCTFVVHKDGGISACGKGSYGRLGLGDSNNQASPRRLTLEARVRRVSSSKGSDGHTIALSTAGHVYTWGDGQSSIIHVKCGIDLIL